MNKVDWEWIVLLVLVFGGWFANHALDVYEKTHTTQPVPCVKSE